MDEPEPNDYEQVIAMLFWLRANGFAAAQVTIGSITIAGLIDTKLVASGPTDVTVTRPPASTAADLYRQFGGKAYEELLAQADEERGE